MSTNDAVAAVKALHEDYSALIERAKKLTTDLNEAATIIARLRADGGRGRTPAELAADDFLDRLDETEPSPAWTTAPEGES